MSIPMTTHVLRRMIDTGDVQVCSGSSCPGADPTGWGDSQDQ